MRSSHGIGFYAANEGHVVMLPHGYTHAVNRRPIIFLHGAGSTSTHALHLAGWESQNALLRTLVEAGFPLLSIDAAGVSAWGNDAAMSRIDDALAWFVANYGVHNQAHLFGVSMGGLTAFNYAKRSPANVLSVVGVIPVLDLKWARDNNIAGSATVSINGAYPPTYDDAVLGATKNPKVYMGAGGIAAPSLIYYTNNDAWTLLATSRAVADRADVAGINLGPLDHASGVYSAINAEHLIAFLEEGAAGPMSDYDYFPVTGPGVFSGLADIIVEIAPYNDPSTPVGSCAWIDISTRCRGLEIKRGGQREVGRVEAGTLRAVLDNRDRAFDPNFAFPGGTYAVPMMRVRVRARYVKTFGTVYAMFMGYADSMEQQWRGHSDAIVDFTATDGFKVLANQDLAESVWEFEVRQDDPEYWFRLDDEESSQIARNTMDIESKDGTYMPLARPPSRAEGLNRYDPNAGAYFDARIGTEDAGDPRGQRVMAKLALSVPFSISVIFLADIIRMRSEDTDLANAIYRYVFNYYTDGDVTPGDMDIEFHMQTSPWPTGPGADTFGGMEWNMYLVHNAGSFLHYGRTVNYDSYLDNKPHICTMTFDGRYAKTFLDEVLIRTTDGGAGLVFPDPLTGTLLIGSDEVAAWTQSPGLSFIKPWGGWLDEFIVHYSALSDARVLELHRTLKDPWKGDRTDERITRILDAIDWPVADRSLNVGDCVLSRATGLGSRALEYIADVVGSEQGRLFMSRDGKVTFLNRHAIYQSPLADIAATFGDGGGSELPYFDLKLEHNDASIINKATATRIEGIPQTVEDAPSQARYLERAVDVTTMHDRDSETRALAEWLVYMNKDPHQRVNELRVRPQAAPATMIPVVLSLDIGNRIVIRRRPPPLQAMYSEEVIIEGLQHVITPSAWETTYWLSPAEQLDVLVVAPTDDMVAYPNSTLGVGRAPL